MRIENSPTQIDLYLAGMMRPSNDLLARLGKVGVDVTTARRAAEQINRTLFADPLNVTAKELIAYFGASSQTDPLGISYELRLWPDHLYTWHVDDSGYASHGGFLLRVPSAVPRWMSKNLESACQWFRPWYHTASDVQRTYGLPDVDLSWFPQQGWYYGPLSGDMDLFFDFDLGLLCSISLEPSAVNRHESEP